jgi:hypothetical protein
MLGSFPEATTPVDESQGPLEEAAGQEA